MGMDAGRGQIHQGSCRCISGVIVGQHVARKKPVRCLHSVHNATNPDPQAQCPATGACLPGHMGLMPCHPSNAGAKPVT